MASTTVTPTATWHNTSLQQSNGDVTDVTVGAAVTGRDALDNIAYLTGGNTNTSVRRISTVATLAALKALTDQRDQDYVALDSDKRVYQFDSGSSATADDFSVVQPTTGTGRWILSANVVPKSTTLRRVLSSWDLSANTGTDFNYSISGGRAIGSNTSAGGSTETVYGQISDFNVGDVISELEIAGSLVNAAGDATATFYSYDCADGDSTPTMTSLGTASSPASAGTFNVKTALGSPLTITSGMVITVTVALTNQAGTSSDAKLFFVAVNGTRSYITE